MVGASCCGNRPLGPFVPAPPEMAMQFLREGPAPFHPGAFIGGFDGDGNGMARGHKRLPIGGPMMGGGVLDVPHMMMPPSHAMHRDPRSVRRLASLLLTFLLSSGSSRCLCIFLLNRPILVGYIIIVLIAYL